MIDLDKKEYFSLLDKWFKILPEPKSTPDNVDKELVEIAKEYKVPVKNPTR